MKKLILLAGAAGLFLVSAAETPNAGKTEGELSSVVAAPAPKDAPASKAAPVAAAKPKPAPAAATQTASSTAYPRCSATVRDRCVQGGSRSYAPAPERRIQLASRAGERG
ncbi:MAG TPA: hypothetical protein VEZ70_01335 [Allosphingosinicella sp.]|nr:hypothetical protein [Allosphingosinicella sp.]